MITRRFLIVASAAGVLAPQALAKKGDTDLPPDLSALAGTLLTRADGAATTLGAELGVGRAAVISLWATWCAPCLAEMQMLSVLRDEIPADRMDIVGINIDAKRDEAKIAMFLQRGRVNFTQLRGDQAPTYAAFGGEPPTTLPRVYVFGRDGKATLASGKYSGGKTLQEIGKAARKVAGA